MAGRKVSCMGVDWAYYRRWLRRCKEKIKRKKACKPRIEYCHINDEFSDDSTENNEDSAWVDDNNEKTEICPVKWRWFE